MKKLTECIFGKLAGLRRDQRGAALLEFTLVAPALIFLGFGLAEFGRALQQHHVVNKAIKDAARYLARQPVDMSSCPGTPGAIASADLTNGKNVALRGSLDNTAPLLLSHWTDPATITVTVNCYDNTGGGFIGGDYLPIVVVSTVVPYDDLGLLSGIGITSMNIRITHQEFGIGE